MNELARLIGNKEQFPILDQWDFFNHAGVAPISRAAADVLRKHAAEAESGAYLGTSWYADIERLRESAAGLINARRDEIALVKNTSEGISIVANSIDWNAGDRVVITNVEYPANVYPWMEAARRFGVELVMVAEQTNEDASHAVPLDAILREIEHPRARLVSLSHVEYASGQRHDIAAIGNLCRAKGKLFHVDAIQTVGVLPVDVDAMNIDFLSADGHKWMLGPEGAGIFYCRRELIEQTRPLTIGWLNVINADQYGHYDFTLKPDAGRFECGTYNVPGLLSLGASIDLIAGAGIEAIAERVKKLSDRLAEGARRKGYTIVSPRTGGQWAAAVVFVSLTLDHAEIARTLRTQHRTEIALREGRLRVSPHFYNTEAQIDRLIEHLPPH